MLRSNVLLVLSMGFICSTAEENQHICRKDGFIYDRRCFWVIFDLISGFTSAQAEEKCKKFDALPANIYDLQHFNQVFSYGRGKAPADYIAFLGMKYDLAANVFTNYDGSIASLPDSVWSQNAVKSNINVVIIILQNSPEDTLNGFGTAPSGASSIFGVICETEQLSCSPPQINMETQILTCSEVSLTCTITCKPNFVLDDGSTSATLTCQDNLEWDGEVPTCRPECEKLSFDGQSGLMQCTGNKYQDECNFVCDSHKQLKGPRKRICNEDGTWSEIQPTCEDVICKPIDFPSEQGTVDCTDGYNYASYCSFYCKTGLQRWGAKKVVCLWTGEWSEEPPTCKKYDPKCPAAHKHTSCPDTNCDVNADCDDDKKLCCPTKCGTSVCWDLPKQTISRGRCSRGYVVPNCNQQQCANYRCITHGQQISHYYASQYYNPNILCRMSSCGGCFPQFYDRRGRRINCRQILQLVSNPGIPVANLP
ncbi:uncharacterized protein LOC120346777 isoform X2 [Styela clava]